MPVTIELPLLGKLGVGNNRVQEDLASNAIPQTGGQVVALLKQVIYCLTPCHLQFSIPFNPGTNRLCLETNCLAYCCFTLKTNPETLVVSCTEESTFFAVVPAPTTRRHPVVTCSVEVMLFSNDYSQTPPNGNSAFVDTPMGCAIVEVKSVKEYRSVVLALAAMSICLKTHTLWHSE